MSSEWFRGIAEATHASTRPGQVDDGVGWFGAFELGRAGGSLFFGFIQANFDVELVRAAGRTESGSAVTIRTQAKQNPISANVKGSLYGSGNFTVNKVINCERN